MNINSERNISSINGSSLLVLQVLMPVGLNVNLKKQLVLTKWFIILHERMQKQHAKLWLVRYFSPDTWKD